MKIDERQSKLFQRDKEKLIRKFQSLEQKVASLIEFTEALNQEKADFIEKLRVQKETPDTISKEVVSLRAEKEKEKHRILTLIERVDRMFLGIN
jgi:phage I-like protein